VSIRGMLRGMSPSRRPLRLLHTADVHLEGDGYGDSGAGGDVGRRTFRRIVDRALTDDVDLLLIAGDLFDHNRVSDDTVGFVRAELDRFRRPIVILPGNHDCLEPNGVHARHDLTRGAPHVRVIRALDGELLELPELDAVVWGRGMREHAIAFQPLAGIPRRDEGRWCLGMGHGFFFDAGERPDRSSPIFADQIRDSGWDYLALGHHHVQTDVSQGGVTAYFAGLPGTVLSVECSAAAGIRVRPTVIT
jgi:DNA repair protein SbcD/Mre11